MDVEWYEDGAQGGHYQPRYRHRIQTFTTTTTLIIIIIMILAGQQLQQ